MLCCNITVHQAADYVTKQGLHFLDTIHACNIKPWRKIEFFSFGEKTLNQARYSNYSKRHNSISLLLQMQKYSNLYTFLKIRISLLYYKVCIQIGILQNLSQTEKLVNLSYNYITTNVYSKNRQRKIRTETIIALKALHYKTQKGRAKHLLISIHRISLPRNCILITS